MEQEFSIQARPVRNRNQKPLKLPGGFTATELVGILMVFFVSGLIGLSGMPRLAVVGLAVAYIKLLKDNLPDNFASNMARFFARKHFTYRAGARDASWRPPVIASRSRRR